MAAQRKRASRRRRSRRQAHFEEQLQWAQQRFEQLLEGLQDPRRRQGVRYPLLTVVMVALMASVCGADDAEAMQRWGEEHEWWLERLLPMPHGAPTQDVFLSVFASLQTEQLQRVLLCWSQWLQRLLQRQQGGFPPRRGRRRLPPLPEAPAQLAVDGKRLKGSRKGGHQVHMVGAMLAEQGLLLCRYDCTGGGELDGVLRLLELLDLRGLLVSADAGLCHKELCELLQRRGAQYVLRVKGNQPILYEQLRQLFEEADQLRAGQRWPADSGEPPRICSHTEQWDKGHGRLERRALWVSDALSWVPALQPWPGASWVARVERQRTVLRDGRPQQQGSVETGYLIGSGPVPSAEQALQWARSHWQVENGAHWVLDVAFGEDRLSYRSERVAQNLALLRSLALNLLKADKSVKLGVKNKRLKAAWNPAYMLQLLSGPIPQPEQP